MKQLHSNNPEGRVPRACQWDTIKNEDGSIDLYFGPTRQEGVAATNFIKTVEGRAFITVIRLYGTGIEFFDQTWKPDDVVKQQ